MNKIANKRLKKFLILYTMVILYTIALSISYTLTFALDNSPNRQNSIEISSQGIADESKQLVQFSKFVTAKLNDTISTLELASENHLLNNFDYMTNVSEKLHGIPNDLEEPKRDLLSSILKANPDIASIFLVLPGGDIYLGEPFSDQKQLSRLNFADREWYRGANIRDSLYVSTVFSSAAINAPAIAVAVPIKNSESNGPSLLNKTAQSDNMGYLVAIMNFNYTRELSYKYSEGTNNTFYLVDKNGTELINSNKRTYSMELESFEYIDFIKSDTNPSMTAKFISKGDHASKYLYLMPITITGNTWYIIMMTAA